jgi:hypothetical protein
MSRSAHFEGSAAAGDHRLGTFAQRIGTVLVRAESRARCSKKPRIRSAFRKTGEA